MDFFDPKKQKQHAIRLGVGYILIAIALVLATTILLYQTNGFGVDKNGKVFQNGLVFVSSEPHGANIDVNNVRYKSQTNTRMAVPAGQYTVSVSLSGYRSWQRAISVDGGSVERFDYPFLFPTKLTTTATEQYNNEPLFVTQSRSNRWLLVAPTTGADFDMYDLNASKPTPKLATVPSAAMTSDTTTTNWQVVAWAGDNNHVLLHRDFQDQKDSNTGSEYILFDTQDPTQSQNLTHVLDLDSNADTVAFRNLAYNDYYVYNQTNGVLSTATLKAPTFVTYLTNVINYAADGNTVLYATTEGAPTGKVLMRVRQSTNAAYTVRTASTNTSYLLDLTNYNGTEYALIGAQNENKVYVYQDPLAALKAAPGVATPLEIMKINHPTYVDFSPNARFALAENAGSLETYDLENDNAYAYQVKTPFDAPQVHANWMDGFHLDMVSNGKVLAFDFDGANMQALNSSDAGFVPAFDPSYHFLYTFTPTHTLTSTSLLIK